MKLPCRMAHGAWLLMSDREYSVCYVPRSSWRRIGRAGSWWLGSYEWDGSTPHESAKVEMNLGRSQLALLDATRALQAAAAAHYHVAACVEVKP